MISLTDNLKKFRNVKDRKLLDGICYSIDCSSTDLMFDTVIIKPYFNEEGHIFLKFDKDEFAELLNFCLCKKKDISNALVYKFLNEFHLVHAPDLSFSDKAVMIFWCPKLLTMLENGINWFDNAVIKLVNDICKLRISMTLDGI